MLFYVVPFDRRHLTPAVLWLLQGDYCLVYDTYCNKTAARKDLDDDKSPIYTAYTRDDHVRACHELLSSTDACEQWSVQCSCACRA
jgi:hypothetical protein